MSVVIGVVGASGVVGRTAVALLHTWGVGRLRLGGRRVHLAERIAIELLDGAADVREVDAFEPAQVSAFCRGCDVVLNCAGPSFAILDRVAVAAGAASASYVDPGGDAPVYRSLASGGWIRGGGTALLTAGMMPGLSGLLPRWLARNGFDRVRRITAYVGGRGRLTPAGAADYLLSLGQGIGEPLAAWRNGSRVARALEPLDDVALPYFSPGASAYPFLGPETERLARALAVDDVSWYSVFDGHHMRTALPRLQGAMTGQADTSAAAAALSRAAELDLFGRDPYQAIVVELEGERDGQPVCRTAVLRATDGHELTGAVAAAATAAVVGGRVAAGVHYAADALDPDIVDRVCTAPSVTSFDVFDGRAAEAVVEEGCL